MLSCCERDATELGCFPFESHIVTELEASLTDGRSVTGEDKVGWESEDARDQSLGLLFWIGGLGKMYEASNGSHPWGGLPQRREGFLGQQVPAEPVCHQHNNGTTLVSKKKKKDTRQRY